MLILINSLILLGLIGVALGCLFWKHFAGTPKEIIRAIVATVTGTLAMVLFLFQAAIMTLRQGENLITFISMWLASR